MIAMLFQDNARRRLSREERFCRSMCSPEQKHAGCAAGYAAVRDLFEEVLREAAMANRTRTARSKRKHVALCPEVVEYRLEAARYHPRADLLHVHRVGAGSRRVEIRR